MSGPVTSLHYTPNSNFNGSTYAPGADGFNLADVSSVGQVNSLPAGVEGLVWLGYTNGADATFQAEVNQFIGNPKVFGFYLADEPGPTVSAANLKAESDYIHAVDPGAKTFIVLENNGTPTNPSYSFNPGNTDIDLFGLDPYPVRPEFTNGVDYSVIGDAVTAAEADGIPQSAIVPVYQAFGATSGAYSSWGVPTAAEEQTILSTWASYTPRPVFDYAYSWGVQDGDTALSTDPALQAVFATENAQSTAAALGGSTPPAPAPDTLTAQAGTIDVTSGQSFTGPVAIFTDSNTTIAAGALTATINWGDGITSAGTVTGSAGSFTVAGTHDYAAAGSDTVAVTLSENSPGTATATADSTAIVSSPPLPLSTPLPVMTATDSSGTTGNVPVITSGSLKTAVGAGVVSQSVTSGVDTVTVSHITSETLQLDSSNVSMNFISPGTLAVTGGSGTDTITANSGTNTFTAGAGTLTVHGGSGHVSYVFHAGDGLLTIEDFSKRNDTLTVDKSLQSSFQETSDGSGGVMLTFGTAGSGIHLVGVSSIAESKIHFV